MSSFVARELRATALLRGTLAYRSGGSLTHNVYTTTWGTTVSRSLLGTVDVDNRIPVGQPLRVIRDIANTTLRATSAELGALVSPAGRASRPPKRLLRPLLLQTFDPIRPARQLVERIEFGRLIR